MSKSKKSEELKEELQKLSQEVSQVSHQEAKDSISTSKGETKRDIRVVRFYQSVQFDKEKIITQFSYNDKYFSSKKDMKMWLDSDIKGVFVSSDNDEIFVPLANVKFIQFFTDSTKNEAVKARQALG